MNASKSLDRAIIGGTVLLTLCLVPVLLKFDRTHSDWSSDSSAAVARMSQGERDDLLANFTRLHKQSADKRDKVEAVHVAVANDPEMAARLDAYNAWLRELNIVERDSVHSEPTARKKATRIETLLSEEENRYRGFAFEPDVRSISRAVKDDNFARKFVEDFKTNELLPLWISNREYDKMVDVFVSTFPPEMQKTFQQSVDKIPASSVESEKFRLRAAAMSKVMFASLRTRGGRVSFSMTAETADKVLDTLEDSEKREKLKSLDDRQKAVVGAIIRMQGLNPFPHLQQYYPNGSEVQDFFAQLPRPEMIKLMGSPPGESQPHSNSRQPLTGRRRLDLMYVGQNEQAPEDLREMAKSILERTQSYRSRGGGRGGRGGDRERGNERNGERSGERRPERGGGEGGERPGRGGGPPGRGGRDNSPPAGKSSPSPPK